MQASHAACLRLPAAGRPPRPARPPAWSQHAADNVGKVPLQHALDTSALAEREKEDEEEAGIFHRAERVSLALPPLLLIGRCCRCRRRCAAVAAAVLTVLFEGRRIPAPLSLSSLSLCLPSVCSPSRSPCCSGDHLQKPQPAAARRRRCAGHPAGHLRRRREKKGGSPC